MEPSIAVDPSPIAAEQQRELGSRRRRKSDARAAAVFLAPAVIGFVIFYLVPIVRGFKMSLTDWNLLEEAKWVGFDNYVRLLEDETFINAVKVTVIYVVVNITTQTILGLLIAMLMMRVSQSTLIRSTLLLPWLIPNVTIAAITLFVLDPTVGLLNHLLSFIEVGPISFYGDSSIAIYTVALVNSWRNMGYTGLLLFAGMQTIPKMIYESAEVEGASTWQTFRLITVPLLRPILVMVVVVSMIGSFQIFDTVSVATSGGPGNSTRVIYLYIYEKAFQQFDMGYASAMAVVLMLALVILTLFQLKLARSSESDMD
ncbi:sugar ABC transporter permease [Trueperella pyogenes TP8]|uniref:carbohydrate ABC transporter permease n=1 Tax=Trueperella pyogenes TaxID=1661 RepID=UPI000581FA9E|nr:sugar ABC transporter permease [Trueperella pyogenes]AJC68891.1 sugar ABC transporter permease [Trueperella pyogenes TP8]MCI7689863.1 sugar ABC transporter permease [Trueperella pyogenes]